MLRGDDVAELQQRLGALGFDAGRVDGIFGPETASALENFQRNAGLPTDGIFGPDSRAALTRLGGRDSQANVATVRERDQLLHRDTEGGTRRLAIGEVGGLGAVVDTCARHIRSGGIRVDIVSHPDESHQAKMCNALVVDCYLGVVADLEERCSVSYFATDGFESAGGSRLADLLAAELEAVGFDRPVTLGQRLPVLRETRMPAVVVRIGPTAALVERTALVADVITSAVTRWFTSPADPEPG